MSKPEHRKTWSEYIEEQLTTNREEFLRNYFSNCTDAELSEMKARIEAHDNPGTPITVNPNTGLPVEFGDVFTITLPVPCYVSPGDVAEFTADLKAALEFELLNPVGRVEQVLYAWKESHGAPLPPKGI
jgi:hypothetical protein